MKEKIKEKLIGLGYEGEDCYEDLINALCIKEEREIIIGEFKEWK